MLIQGINAVFNLNVLDLTKLPYNLDETSIQLVIVKPDSKNVCVLLAEIINAAEGRARVFFSPEDLSEGGTYKYQLSVTFPDNTVSKSAISAFYVADSIMLPIAGEQNG